MMLNIFNDRCSIAHRLNSKQSSGKDIVLNLCWEHFEFKRNTSTELDLKIWYLCRNAILVQTIRTPFKKSYYQFRCFRPKYMIEISRQLIKICNENLNEELGNNGFWPHNLFDFATPNAYVIVRRWYRKKLKREGGGVRNA